MKIHTFAISALTAVFLFTGASHANAVEINFAGYNYNMKTVAAGDFGSITTAKKIVLLRNIEMGTTSSDTGFQYDYSKGILPTKTQITFTFNTNPSIFANNPYDQFAEGVGQVSDGTNIYRAWAASDNWTWNEKAGPDGIFSATNSTLGLTAQAYMNAGNTAATLIITNLSNVAANFESYFFAQADDLNGLISTTYSVSAVPLPAALPLFGLALIGMAGYRRRQNKKAA